MRLVCLKGESEVLAGSGESRTGAWSAVVDGVSEKLPVNSIFLEVLVNADVVLIGIVVAGAIEIAGIEDRQGAGDGKVVVGSNVSNAICAGLLLFRGRKRIAVQRTRRRGDLRVNNVRYRILGY